MAASARIARTDLPQPTDAQLDAIDALFTAYMALNTADGSFAHQATPTDPMSLVAKAAVNSLRMLVGISPSAAKSIWTTMIENGENGRYCYDMWRTGDI